ncbi:MAG: 4-(cytidine 5'-diphospho)-2-C-methyl-D-erythritol kinase [Bacteroidota bacterium]
MNSKKFIKLYPNAKINLGLLIKGKRPDGYNLLETLFLPVPDLRDELKIRGQKEDGCSLEVEGIVLDGNPEDNLCYKAYQLLKAEVPDLPGVNLKLKKKIPAGAGLGGGSSDAAATLSGINQLFGLGLSPEKLASIGEKLGADVPFFIFNKPLIARGIGTDFESYELPHNFTIKLVTPPIHSSTIAAYKALDATQFDPSRDLKNLLALPKDSWRDVLPNDLEVPVFEMYPELVKIKQSLYDEGAFYAAMSGSGSAVFGLFTS